MKKFFFGYTGILVLINFIAFMVFMILISIFGEKYVLDFLALQPAAIIRGKYLWTIVTSMFIHASAGHLIANMVSLIFMGGFVERLIGNKRFLKLYFIGGFVASLMFILLAGMFGGSELGAKLFGTPFTYAVGASGAIFALGGLLAILTPKMKVLVFFIIPMPMWAAMIGFVFIIWAISLALPLNIGNSAHFGGLLVGIVYGLFLRIKYPHKTEMISRYFSN
jgi:membrane associated rhomboid family serine protease